MNVWSIFSPPHLFILKCIICLSVETSCDLLCCFGTSHDTLVKRDFNLERLSWGKIQGIQTSIRVWRHHMSEIQGACLGGWKERWWMEVYLFWLSLLCGLTSRGSTRYRAQRWRRTASPLSPSAPSCLLNYTSVQPLPFFPPALISA